MARVVLVIGNGFDIQIGLKTKYSEYLLSEIFQNEIVNKYKKSGQNLFHKLEKEASKENWFDLEDFLAKIGSDLSIYYDYNYHLELKDNFRKYLLQEKDRIMPILNEGGNLRIGVIVDFLKKIKSKSFINVMDFNFTQSLEITFGWMGKKYNNGIKYYYPNGHLGHSTRFLLGVGDESFIPSERSFLYKSSQRAENPGYDMIKSMKDSHYVIFFGHSIAKSDEHYFRDFFRSFLVEKESYPVVYIVTKDENSKFQIVENIRRIVNREFTLFSLRSNLEWMFDGDNYVEKIKIVG